VESERLLRSLGCWFLEGTFVGCMDDGCYWTEACTWLKGARNNQNLKKFQAEQNKS
jgi:hypothetical protein